MYLTLTTLCRSKIPLRLPDQSSLAAFFYFDFFILITRSTFERYNVVSVTVRDTSDSINEVNEHTQEINSKVKLRIPGMWQTLPVHILGND